MRLSPITEFALLARSHDDVLDLEALAVCVARMGTPDLDGRAVSAALDTMADQVRDGVSPTAPPDRLAAQLRDAFVSRLGFCGDRDAPREPEDSYLDAVLARRRGLPILLAIVWILLGRRLGVPIAGVSFPGHFLACVDLPGARVYVDPFHAGATREAAELLHRLGPRSGERRALEPAPTRAIVTRVLANLKNLWVDKQDHARALEVVDRMLLIGGESGPELRDRGLLCLHVGRPAEATRDFRRYLKIMPEAEDRAVIEALLTKIAENG